jgi:methylated-DNA-[protein]-cysteine S-methyltransferase
VQGFVKSVYFYETEMGKIGIAENGEAIVNLLFPGEGAPLDAVVQETDLLREVGDQLRSYLAGKRKTFTVPLAPNGTEFMQRTWEQLRAIPYRETRTYGEIAEHTGNRNASRAVGLACNRNPIPIFIPCHRVIGSNGNLTGYRGGLTVKAQLLDREKDGLL